MNSSRCNSIVAPPQQDIAPSVDYDVTILAQILLKRLGFAGPGTCGLNDFKSRFSALLFDFHLACQIF
jgi:hypothetical protein